MGVLAVEHLVLHMEGVSRRPPSTRLRIEDESLRFGDSHRCIGLVVPMALAVEAKEAHVTRLPPEHGQHEESTCRIGACLVAAAQEVPRHSKKKNELVRACNEHI